METIPNEILKESLKLVTTNITIDNLIELTAVSKLWYEMINTFVLYIYEGIMNNNIEKFVICYQHSDDIIEKIDNHLIVYMKNCCQTSLRDSVYLCKEEQTYVPLFDLIEEARKCNFEIINTGQFAYDPCNDKERVPTLFYVKYLYDINNFPLEYFDRIERLPRVRKFNKLLLISHLKFEKIFKGSIGFANGEISRNYYNKYYEFYTKLYQQRTLK